MLPHGGAEAVQAVEDKMVQETELVMGQRLVTLVQPRDLTQQEPETVPQPVHVLLTRGQDRVPHPDTGRAGGEWILGGVWVRAYCVCIMIY